MNVIPLPDNLTICQRRGRLYAERVRGTVREEIATVLHPKRGEWIASNSFCGCAVVRATSRRILLLKLRRALRQGLLSHFRDEWHTLTAADCKDRHAIPL